VTSSSSARHATVRTSMGLEWLTLLWNVVGVAVLAYAAYRARSVALAGFGIDSLVEIGASVVVLWELRGIPGTRRAHGLRLIGLAFILLAVYLAVQSLIVIASGFHPLHSSLGIAWTAVTAGVMWILSRAKRVVGRALENPVLIAEGRVTMVDAILAAAVLAGLSLNAGLGWWWADPAAGLVIFAYAAKEGTEAIRHSRSF
jgi:divalent metal cation (Fe/Co/Zn/Cd) transporter